MTRDPKEKNSLNLFLNDYFNIIIVGVVLIVLVVAYFLIIQPKYDSTMSAIKVNIEQQQRLYTEQVKKLNNLKTISSLYEKISPADLKKCPEMADLAGHIAESAFGFYLATIPALGVACFPERGSEPEVDFVMEVGDKRIPVEIKYRSRIDSHEDTIGLRAFLEKTVYNAPFAILITRDDGFVHPDKRIISMSLSSFLWLR